MGGEIFCTCPDRRRPPILLYNGYRVFPGGKAWPGHDADSSPPSSAVVKKGQSYTSTPPMGHTACTEPQCLYKGALYLTFSRVAFVRTVTSNHKSCTSRIIAEKLTVPQLVKKFPAFNGTRQSLPQSQQHSTRSYPKPDQSSSCPQPNSSI